MAKKKIERFCIFRNKKENTVRYFYNYSKLLYLPRVKIWMLIDTKTRDIEEAIHYLTFENYSLIGEFRGYRIK